MAAARLKLLGSLFLMAGVVFFLRFFQIQVWQHQDYVAKAAEQHWRSLVLSPERGLIKSADGFVLVDNRPAFLLYAHPRSIVDGSKTALALAEIIFDERFYTSQEKKMGLGNLKKFLVESFIKKLNQKDLFWVSLVHKLSPDQKKRIEELKILGLGFEEETERFYPEGDLAAFILGFVGQNRAGEDTGYYGLEGYYNGDLKGEPGRVYEEQTASGNPILLGGFQKLPPKNGRELTTTINRSLQFIIERGLKKSLVRYRAKSGTVILIEPNTGAILAMASQPSFDPSYWSKVARQMKEISGREAEEALNVKLESFRNPAISETYEPGSVLKGLTLAAGLDDGAVTPQTTFNDSGPLTIGAYRVDNWDGKHHGRQTMIEVLQKSNNMGAAFVAKQLGAQKLRSYFLKFGLGRRLGVDLEGEDSGIVKNLKDFKEIDLVTNSFGQGISVTPLQLTVAFAALANGGTLYKPYLVSQIREENKVNSFGPEVLRRVLPQAKAAVMVEMLTAAAEGGEAKFFVLKSYRVAGKTGTAQIPAERGGYDPTKTNATFVGFLPNSRKFVMMVRLAQPSTSVYAAETAVPLWMEMTKDLVAHLGLPPDR